MRRQLLASGLVIFFGLITMVAHAVRSTVIYGEDDRQDYFQVESAWKTKADATVALMRASSLEVQGTQTKIKSVPYGQGLGLCTSEPFFEQETAAFCSGFLVAPDTVVTAGHCVRTQQSCDATKFVFGFRLDVAGVLPSTIDSDHVFNCSQMVYSVANPTGEDFAVVKLDRPVPFVAPLSFRARGKASAGDSLKVIGHPSGLPLKIAGGAAVRSVAGEFLVANLDTYGGNSGSAVFNAVTGEIEGVLVRGEMDFVIKNGCRISNRCDDDKCRGEDVTLFERVLPHIPVN